MRFEQVTKMEWRAQAGTSDRVASFISDSKKTGFEAVFLNVTY
jgi:hypothetical protein